MVHLLSPEWWWHEAVYQHEANHKLRAKLADRIGVALSWWRGDYH